MTPNLRSCGQTPTRPPGIRGRRKRTTSFQCCSGNSRNSVVHLHDGNGRLGRLIIVLQLLRAGVLSEPLLTVSPWFEARRIDYQDNLQRVSMTGDWDSWVQFFAQGIQAQAESTATKVSELLAYRDRVRIEARNAGMKGLAIDMLDELFTWSVVTAASVARRRTVSPQAVNTAINKLVNLGAMREQTGRNYNRVFAATEVVNILLR